MAKWRKILTSGSAIDVTTIHNESAVNATFLTGSFTGSFTGDGSNLTGTGFNIDELSNTLTTLAEGDLLVAADVDASNEEKKITFANLRDDMFSDISGDATVTAGGALTIAADSVEGTMLNTNAADTSTIELSSDTLSVLKVPNALTVDNATIALNSGTTYDGSGAVTIAVKDGGIDADALATGVAGTGIDGGGGSALSINANQTFTTLYNTGLIIGRAANDTTINFTSDDVITFDVGSTAAMTIDATSGTSTTAVTIAGDLIVNGTTTTVNSANLEVKDAFIFAASGSSGANVDGGLIVQEGSNEGTGSAIYHDTGDNRWAVAKDIKSADTAVTALEHVVTVKQLADNDAAIEGDKEYGPGEMAINSDGTIWIYS